MTPLKETTEDSNDQIESSNQTKMNQAREDVVLATKELEKVEKECTILRDYIRVMKASTIGNTQEALVAAQIVSILIRDYIKLKRREIVKLHEWQ